MNSTSLILCCIAFLAGFVDAIVGGGGGGGAAGTAYNAGSGGGAGNPSCFAALASAMA